MEAKWSSLVSYGMSLNALQDFLPLDLALDVKTVRYDTLKVAKRLEAELGEEQAEFLEGEPSDWDLLPLPEGAFKVGLDGGYVRNWFDKKLQRVAGDRVPFDHLLAADSDLLNNDAQLVVHDAQLPPAFL
jgi:hypothetical protein